MNTSANLPASNTRREFLLLTLTATVIGLSICAILGVVFIRTQDVRYLILAGLTLTVPVTHWVSWYLVARRNRPRLGLALIASSLWLVVVVPPLWVIDYWVIGALLAMIIPIDAGLAGQPRRIPFYSVLALCGGAALLAVDLWLAPAGRLDPLAVSRFGFLGILGLLAVFLILLAPLFWRTQLRHIQFNLGTQLAIVFIGISAVSTLVVMVVLLAQTGTAQVAQVGQNFQTLAEINAERVGNTLEQQIVALQGLGRQSGVVTLITSAYRRYGARRGTPELVAELRQEEATWQTLNATSSLVTLYFNGPAGSEAHGFIGNNPGHSQILLTDVQGALIGASGESKPAHYYYGDEAWWQAAFNNGLGDIYISQLQFDPATNATQLLIAVPIPSREYDAIIGVAASIYQLDQLQASFAAQMATGIETDLDLLDNQRTTLASGDADTRVENNLWLPDEVFNRPTANWLRSPNQQDVSTIIAYSPLKTSDGAAHVSFRNTATGREPATLEPLTQLGWRVVVRQAEREALASIPRTVKLTTFFGLIILALVVMTATATAAFISRPINALTRAATAIAAGDLYQRATPSGPAEFTTLAEAFNSLTSQLRALINNLQVQVANRTAQLQASTDVGRAASSVLDPEELVRQTVNLITDRFGFYYAAVFVIDEAGQQAVLQEATGEAGQTLKARGHQLAVGGQSMVGTAIAQRRARIALDVGQEAVRFANPLLPHTRSEIALPLLAGGQPLGALDVQSTESGAFDESNAALLQGLADQLAIALQNARLFQSTQRSLREATALEKFSRALTGAPDYTTVLNALTGDLLPARTTTVAILTFEYGSRPALTGPARARFVNRATIVAHRELRSNSRALSGTMLAGEQLPFLNTLPLDLPLAISDINAGPYLDDVSRATYTQWGVRALLCLPLTSGGQLHGMVQVTSAQPYTFEARDIRLLQTAADQIALTLVNIQLFNQTNAALRESSQLYEITSGIARATDVADMLRHIILHALPAGAERAAIARYQVHAGQVRSIDHLGSLTVQGDWTGEAHSSPAEVPDAQSLWANPATVAVNDLAIDTRLASLTRATYARAGLHSVILVPLLTAGQVSGVLEVGGPHPAEYRDEEIRLVQVAADQVAIALANRNLLAEARRRAELQTTANQIFTDIRAATTRAAALEIAAAQIGRTLNAARALIWLQMPYGELGLVQEYTRPDVPALPPHPDPLPAAVEAARTRTAVIASSGDPLVPAGTSASLALPLLVRGELLGVFNLHEIGRDRYWTPDEITLAQDTATQVATSLENIDLVERLQTSLKEVEDLNRVFIRQGWDEYRQIRRAGALREVFTEDAERAAPVDEAAPRYTLPLNVRGESIGEISVAFPPESGAFTADERVLAEAIADQIALSLDNARLIEQTQQRVSELGVINQISQALTTRLDLRQQLRQVGESLIRVFNVPNGYIALYDTRTNLIEIPFLAEGAERITIDPFPLGEGVSSHIIHTRRPLLLNHDTERRMAELGAKIVGKPARSFLGVPIITGNEVIGVVNVQSTEQAGLFNDADLSLLTTVAANIGAAIQNARLFEETQRRAEQLATAAEVSRTSNAMLDPEALVRQAVELIRERFKLYYVAIFMTDDTGRWAELRHATGEAGQTLLQRKHRLEIGGQSMVGTAISQRKARVALDVGLEAVRFANPLLPETRSELALPLSVGPLTFGALDVQSTQPNAFSEVDLAVLQTMADQIATSVQNARLFAATQRSAQQLAAAAEVGRAATATLDLDSLLQTSLDLIRNHFGLYAALIFIVEPSSNQASLRAATGQSAGELLAQRLQVPIGTRSLIGVATAARQPRIVADVALEPDYLPHPLLPETRSEAVLPLLSGDEIIGALDLQSAQANTFGASDVSILSTIADQLAVAVQNARLFEKTSRQARREKLTGEITGKIRAAGDMDQMLKIAVTELRQALGVSQGVVRLGARPTVSTAAPPASDEPAAGSNGNNGDNGHH